MHKILLLTAASLLFPASAQATVNAVEVTGFNQDIVVDALATMNANAEAFVTATMDGIITPLDGSTWYEKGFNHTQPLTGLPSGTLVNSLTGNGTFRLQPSAGKNALLLNNANPNGALALSTPASYSLLAVYDATGNGSGSIGYTLNFLGGATQTGTFVSSDWFSGEPKALIASGRAIAPNGEVDAVNQPNPRIYEHLITVSNGAPVESISFSRATNDGNTAIFAVSGTPVPEPTSLALLALGSIGLLARQRR